MIGLLALSAALYAGWEYVGPEGGPIQSGAITAGPDKTIFVASSCERVPLLRSSDAGQSWHRAYEDFVTPPEAIAANATDPALLYIIRYGHVFGTTDGGNSWTQLGAPSTATFFAIDVNPDDWQEIFASGHQDANGSRLAVIGHSTDGGQNWDIQTLGTVWGSAITAIRVWSGDPDTIYASGTDNTGMFYESTDRGASWNVISSSAPVAYALDIDPADVDLLLAGTGGGVFRSSNGGTSWSQVLSGDSRFLSRSACQADLVYAAAGGGVYRSLDAGQNWTEVTDGLQGEVARCVLADPTDDDLAYCGTSVGMYRSTDRGSSWIPAINGLLLYANFCEIAASPLDPGLVYASGANCYALDRSTDQGSSWTKTNTFTGCGTLNGLSASPVNADEVWAFEGSG